jgi:deoxyadenosine/deoxycytidine kinase
MLLEYFEIFVKNLFVNGLMEKRFYDILELRYQELLKLIVFPQIIIFLKADMDSLFDRIKLRSRAGEVENISRDYMNSLAKRYEDFLVTLQNNYPNTHLIIIESKDKDSNQVFEEATFRIDQHLNRAAL